MDPSISFVTLGVADVARALRFYRDGLRLPVLKTGADAAFLAMGGTRLALYRRDLLAADGGVPAEGEGFARFALAHNVESPEAVDALLAQAAAAGARVTRAAAPAAWGGRAGWFTDPDGFLWEVAWNPARMRRSADVPEVAS